MLRRTPLFQATDRQLVSSGLQPDLHPAQKLLWEIADNVQFYQGKIKRRKPSTELFNTLTGAPARGLGQQRLSDGTRRVWAAFRPAATNTLEVVYWDGLGVTNLVSLPNAPLDETVLAGAAYADFTFWGDWAVINYRRAGKAWLFQNPGLTQPAEFPDEVQLYAKKLNFLLALGTGPRRTGVAWSDADDITTWAPAANNLAGELFIDDFDTGIIASARLGNAISVYAEDQQALVSYVGGDFVFGQKLGLDGIGAVGKLSVCTDPSGNYGVSRNGCWWTDGNSFRYIDEGFLRDYLQDNVNWGQKSKIICARNDYRGTIEFSFPMGISLENSESWAYDPRTGGWSKVPAFQIMDERRLLAKPLIGQASDGRIYFVDDNPGALAALNLETRALLMQVQDQSGLRDVHTESRVDELDLLAKAASNVEVAVGVSDGGADGTYTWTNWMPVSGQSTTYKLDWLPSGVYWKVKFRSTSTNWDLDLQGFMLFGQVEGTKRGNTN